MLSAPGGLEALRSVLRYIRLVTEQEGPARVEHVLGELLGREVREAYVTEGERLIATGEVRGQSRIVRRQLEVRFGPLPAWAQSRIEGADAEELERYAERLLTASSLEEVFAES